MKITEAFKILRRHGYVLDQYSFDESWLGKKPGYFAYLKSTDSQPSIETLMRLHFKLLEENLRHARLGLDAAELHKLATLTFKEVRHRCN